MREGGWQVEFGVPNLSQQRVKKVATWNFCRMLMALGLRGVIILEF